MFERFDAGARRTLVEAGKLAASEEAVAVSTGHLLRAAIHVDYETPIPDLVAALGDKCRSMDSVRAELLIPEGTSTGSTSPWRLSASVRQVVSLASAVAIRIGSAEVGLRHILLALADQSIDPAADLLQSVGIDLAEFHAALLPPSAPPMGRLVAEAAVDTYVDRKPPPSPDFTSLPAGVVQDLEARLSRIPVDLVRHRADYYALVSVEADHIARLGDEFALKDHVRESLDYWWKGRINSRYPEMEQRLASYQGRTMSQGSTRRRLTTRIRPTFLFQLCFNTLGPGGKCWFGNRYVALRHYTFRFHWRP